MIPQQIRKQLGIKPKTKLAMFSRGEKLVAAKVQTPDAGEELNTIFREIDERYKGKKRPTEREILAEIQAYRKDKRR